MDAVGDLVVVLTKTGQITRVNPAVLHLTGWESTDLIKHPFNVVIQTDDDPETSHDLEHSAVLVAMKEGRDLRKKPASVINQNGQRIPVTMSMYPLRDGNKIIGGIITLNQASQA